MYYLRPDLTVTGYLYRYLSDYIWLNFSQPRCVFHQVTLPSASGRNTFFPDGFAPDSVVLGHHFMDKNDQQTRLEEGAPAKLQSGTLPENFKFTAISIIQWPAPGRQLLMKGRRLGKNEEGIICPSQLPLLTMTK